MTPAIELSLTIPYFTYKAGHFVFYGQYMIIIDLLQLMLDYSMELWWVEVLNAIIWLITTTRDNRPALAMLLALGPHHN